MKLTACNQHICFSLCPSTASSVRWVPLPPKKGSRGCRDPGAQYAGGDSINYCPTLTGLGVPLPQVYMESLLFSSPIPEFQPLRTNACSFLEPPLA